MFIICLVLFGEKYIRINLKKKGAIYLYLKHVLHFYGHIKVVQFKVFTFQIKTMFIF